MTSTFIQSFNDHCHPSCIVCRPQAAGGLGLQFVPRPDGSVEAVFPGGDTYQGYTGVLHGGVIAMLLDAAMTNCLFAQERRSVTADLAVRFRHPVASGQPARLRAELWQADQLRATATGKFMETSGGIIFGRKGHQSPATPSPADSRKDVSAPAADAEAPWPAEATTSNTEGA